MNKSRSMLTIFFSLLFILTASMSFAGNLTLPFNGNHPVSAYYDLDTAKGKTKGYNGAYAYDGHGEIKK